MSATTKKPTLETRLLTDLISYPKQNYYFDDLGEDDLRELARAMREDHVPPIEILHENVAGLPANTILRGHQRRRAAERNGATTVQVLVRYDLAQSDRAA